MREVVDLIIAFVIQLSGVALALLSGILAVRASEAVGIHPASMLLLGTFGFICIVAVGSELTTRRTAA